MSNSRSKGTALITGASRGIGAVYADRLAKRGYDLILVARNEARLKELSARLTKETGRSVTPLRADLSDKADLAKVESMLRDNQAITMLVNNAGIGSVAPLLDADVEKMEDIIALNITALTRLTYAAAPAFVARGTGTIINIASIVMSPEDVVDAALVGLGQSELVTLPSLHEGDEWARFEAARRAMSEKLFNSRPAPRYEIRMRRSA